MFSAKSTNEDPDKRPPLGCVGKGTHHGTIFCWIRTEILSVCLFIWYNYDMVVSLNGLRGFSIDPGGVGSVEDRFLQMSIVVHDFMFDC